MIRIVVITTIYLILSVNYCLIPVFGIDAVESESDSSIDSEIWSNVLQEWAIK